MSRQLEKSFLELYEVKILDKLDKKDFKEVCSLARPVLNRIGKWWSIPALYEACCRKHNRIIIVAKREKKVKGFIVLQKWGSKGKWKGFCKSLVTVSSEKGVATLLQSLLPEETIGYVSVRNKVQTKVMVKSLYEVVAFTEKDKKLNRRMAIWQKLQNSTRYLRDAQRNLKERILNTEK